MHVPVYVQYIWMSVCMCVCFCVCVCIRSSVHSKLSVCSCVCVDIFVCWEAVRVNHTCDVLWADLMERHCTIPISKNAWRCLSRCSSSATRAASSAAEYVHVHILHSTNLIHPLLFFALSNRLVLCVLPHTHRQLYGHQSDILWYTSGHQVIHVRPLLFSAN